MFDLTLQVMGFSAEVEGNFLIPAMTVGMQLPFQQGPGQPPITAPIGQIKFPMAKGDALTFAQALIDSAATMADEPERHDSGLVVANSLDGVDKIADIQNRLKG